jgi:hypothetical protein
MNYGIDWNQNSTKRGAILVLFSCIAIVMIIGGNITGGAAVMAVGQQCAGWLGVVVKD